MSQYSRLSVQPGRTVGIADQSVSLNMTNVIHSVRLEGWSTDGERVNGKLTYRKGTNPITRLYHRMFGANALLIDLERMTATNISRHPIEGVNMKITFTNLTRVGGILI